MPLKIDPDKAKNQAQPVNKLDAQVDAFSVRDANKRQAHSELWREEDTDLIAAAKNAKNPQAGNNANAKRQSQDTDILPPRLDTTQLKKNKQSSPILKVLIILLAIAVVGAGAYFFLLRGNLFGSVESQPTVSEVSSITISAGMTFEEFSNQVKGFCQDDEISEKFLSALCEEDSMSKYAMFNGLAGQLSGDEIMLYLVPDTVISEKINNDNMYNIVDSLLSARVASFSSLASVSSHKFLEYLKTAAYIEQNSGDESDKALLSAVISKNALYMAEPYELCCVSDSSLSAALEPAQTEYDCYEKMPSGELFFSIYREED